MTTQEWLSKNINKPHNNTKYFASVMVDSQGVGYSYGWHYPLVAVIDGVAFVNNAGYSMTTAKHICWAINAAAKLVGWSNVYNVPLERGDSLSLIDIRKSARTEQTRLLLAMAKKSRKNTTIYARLGDELHRINRTIEVADELYAKKLVTA